MKDNQQILAYFSRKRVRRMRSHRMKILRSKGFGGAALNKKVPACTRGRDEYLLTTKLFCGYCREMMTSYGGTGKSGKVYHYYA